MHSAARAFPIRRRLAIRTLTGTLALLVACVTPVDVPQNPVSQCRRFHPPPPVEHLLEAARDGDAECQFFLGVYYFDGDFGQRDFEQAFHWFSKAAEQGHTDSEHYLGIMYSHGKHVRPDQEKAVAHYRKAAERGSALAQFDLAYRYHTGRGVEQDIDLAMHWYRLAAEQGYERAAENLRTLRLEGPGFQATPEFQRVLDGASAGDPDAQWRLANIFANGIPGHVRRDQDRALYWLREAAAGGHEAAKRRLEELGASPMRGPRSTASTDTPWSENRGVATHSPTGLTFPAVLGESARSPVGPPSNPYASGAVSVSYGSPPRLLVMLIPTEPGPGSDPRAVLDARSRVLTSQVPSSRVVSRGQMNLVCSSAPTEFAELRIELPDGEHIHYAAHFKGHLVIVQSRGVILPLLSRSLGWPCRAAAQRGNAADVE